MSNRAVGGIFSSMQLTISSMGTYIEYLTCTTPSTEYFKNIVPFNINNNPVSLC
jgi:hypothetical protein